MTAPNTTLDALRPSSDGGRATRTSDILLRFPGESPSAFLDDVWPTAAAFGAYHITSNVSRLELVRVL